MLRIWFWVLILAKQLLLTLEPSPLLPKDSIFEERIFFSIKWLDFLMYFYFGFCFLSSLIFLFSPVVIPLLFCPLAVPRPIPPPPPPRGCLHTLTPLHPTRPPHSLGPQVSQRLDASSLTEARPGSPLLYTCMIVKCRHRSSGMVTMAEASPVPWLWIRVEI